MAKKPLNANPSSDRWDIYNRTIRDLRATGHNALAEHGLTPADFERVAHTVAFGRDKRSQP